MLEMRKIGESDMDNFSTLLIDIFNSEKTIAALGDGWWPQRAKQEEDTMRKNGLCNI